MADRTLSWDLLVDDRGSARKLDRLGGAFDRTRQKIERLDDAGGKMRQRTDRLGDGVKKLGTQFLGAATATLKLASAAGLVVGAAGPMALGLAAGAAAAAHLAASVAPAAAALAPLAAGLVFVKATLKGMGPAFVEATAPAKTAFDQATASAGRLATKGLRPISQEFVRVNFPAISGAMDRIGRSTNGVVTGFGRWVNSARGVRVVRTLTGDTASTFERLAPAAGRVARSLAEMAGRVSGVSFRAFGDGAEFALNKLSDLIDRIDAGDVQSAFTRIKSGADAVANGFRAIGDAVDWLERNREKIMQFSNSLLVLTAIGAALTGGWVVALGAALLLLVKNWDSVTGAVDKVKGAFSGLPDRFSSLQPTLDALGGAWDDVKEGFRDFVDSVAPHIPPLVEKAESAFIKLQPALTGAAAVAGTLGKAFLQIAGPIVGAIIDGLGLVIDIFGNVALGAAVTGEKVLRAFHAIISPLATAAEKLGLPFADSLRSISDGAKSAADRMQRSLDSTKTDLARQEMDRLQGKVNSLKGKKVKTEADKRAIAQSEARIRQLQGQINRLKGKTVTVTTYYDIIQRTRNAGFAGNPVTGASATGGPVFGPGTGTSDSILMRLSNGEHVLTAREVRAAGGHDAIARFRKALVTGGTAAAVGPAAGAPATPRSLTGGRAGNVTIVVNAPNYVGPQHELAEAVRKVVRDKGGGNVQKALGRAS